jgi:hypothetical protein
MKPLLVLQYDNRPLDDSYSELIKINKRYCEKHNYEYKFIDTYYDLPVYWIKVHLLNEILKTNVYHGIFWLDTDACIYNPTIKLENLMLENKSFYLSPDNKLWDSPFNAGVFMVLNTEMGREIIDEWMKCYNDKDWSKDINNKFSTKGKWGGEVYEQGSFVKNILPKYYNAIHIFNWTFFQTFYSDIDIFTLHFASYQKKNQIPSFLDFKKIVN